MFKMDWFKTSGGHLVSAVCSVQRNSTLMEFSSINPLPVMKKMHLKIMSAEVICCMIMLRPEVIKLFSCSILLINVKMPTIVGILTLNAPIAAKVVCFSRPLKCFRSIYGKQCGPRSDCSYRSSLFWVHAVCFYA